MLEDEPEDRKDFRELSVYQKAIEIVYLVDKISFVLDEEIQNYPECTELELAKLHLDYIVSNAHIIPVKIAGASGVDLYDLRMENATIIRRAAREILVDCTGLKLTEMKLSVDYLQLLRDEIELFRIEFAEWVKTFNELDYIIDRWGLFNPSGVNYDDYDPDDDIPFNPNNEIE